MIDSHDALLENFDDDGLFVYAPSFIAEHSEDILEGKSIGTAREEDLVLNADPTVMANIDPGTFAKQRKSGVTVGKKKLKQAMDRAEVDILSHLMRFEDGDLTAPQFKKSVVQTMKMAWRDVYLAGIRSGGKAPSSTPGVLVSLTTEEQKWLRSAMQHEMRFLNKFVQAVTNNEGVMPYPRRAKMYVNTLTAFYEAARVQSLPATSLIYWLGPNDSKSCASCQYIHAHKVFTKKTLPTTPRAGMTICLSNCRDRLVIRAAPPEKVVEVTEKGPTREQHIRNLRKIKRQGFL